MQSVMDIVKKNLVSIICVVVALIAVALHFYPISGWFADLQTRVGARAGVYNQLRDLLNRDRHLPLVSLEPGAQPARLEQFPTERAITRGEQVKEKIDAEAQALLKAAVELNQQGKKPLTEGVLPQGARTALVRFRTDYLREMDYASAEPARRAASMPVRIMNAGLRPSDQEIHAETKRVTDLINRQELAYDERGRPINDAQVKAKIAEVVNALPARMRADAAERMRVYIDTDSFTILQAITTGPAAAPPPPVAVFWAQVGLWLQEDVCRAIADANSGARNVTDAVVKRVIRVDVPDQFTGAAAQTQQPTGIDTFDDGGGMMMAADPSQPITPNYAISPTGRYSNPLYDVMQFQLSLIVDADYVPHVLQSLSRNRFVTVYETNIIAVDSGMEQVNGYIYGTKPVVRMDMKCEALFLREWLTRYMPPQVRQSLGVLDPQLQQ